MFSVPLLIASYCCTANSSENQNLYLINIGGKWDGEAGYFDGGKYGFIDRTGKIVVSPIFEYAEPFSEGLTALHNGEGWGFIDQSGKMVIPTRFEAVGNFLDGLAKVMVGGKWGFINRYGKMVISPQFEEVWGKFVEDVTPVMTRIQWGIQKISKWDILIEQAR